jgi:hypothetical protein
MPRSGNRPLPGISLLDGQFVKTWEYSTEDLTGSRAYTQPYFVASFVRLLRERKVIDFPSVRSNLPALKRDSDCFVRQSQ